MLLSRTGLALLAALTLPMTTALAADSLPGGANSLRETYDNWVLSCGVQKTGSAPSVVCSVSAEQIDANTKRRAVAVGINPVADGTAKGSILMPFGLALSKGVTIQVDGGQATSPLAYRTCTPGGCIVPLDWTADSVKIVRGGTTLKLAATADNGQPVDLSLPLKGFSAGVDRALELTK